MKLETHLHTACGSRCARVKPEEIPALYKALGYDGIVVTEHFNRGVVENYYDYGNGKRISDCFFEGYRRMKAAADGLKIFFGMEIAVRSDTLPMEYILYGFDRAFPEAHEDLYSLDQRQLYELCRENDILMYQAHPLRDNIALGDLRYLDGLEGFNGHPGHDSRNDRAEALAAEKGLLVMSGSDFHDFGQQGTGGIVLDGDVKDEKELVAAIRAGRYKILRNGEL